MKQIFVFQSSDGRTCISSSHTLHRWMEQQWRMDTKMKNQVMKVLRMKNCSQKVSVDDQPDVKSLLEDTPQGISLHDQMEV